MLLYSKHKTLYQGFSITHDSFIKSTAHHWNKPKDLAVGMAAYLEALLHKKTNATKEIPFLMKQHGSKMISVRAGLHSLFPLSRKKGVLSHPVIGSLALPPALRATWEQQVTEPQELLTHLLPFRKEDR